MSRNSLLKMGINGLRKGIISSLNSENGFSLIELIAATVLVVSVATVLALFYPKATRSSINNRDRLIVRQLAFGKLEDIEKEPYDNIPLTEPDGRYFLASSSCSCKGLADYSAVPSTPSLNNLPDSDTVLYGQTVQDTFARDGIVYTRKVCINYVQGKNGGNWSSLCPGSTDYGMKNIRVGVFWVGVDKSSHSLDLSSVISRG